MGKLVIAALCLGLTGCIIRLPELDPETGERFWSRLLLQDMRDEAVEDGPDCDVFEVGVTTLEEVKALVGVEPSSEEHLPNGRRAVCWYSVSYTFREEDGRTQLDFYYYLHCEFDADGILSSCAERGPMLLPDEGRTCP